MSYEVRLQVYEGPFDLLLALISQRRVDVCDVPIADLTADYLAHLDEMRTLDLDVTTEFLVVAATLLELKARALLPKPPSDDDAFAGEDLERDLLIARLLEVRTFQSAGAHLAGLLAEGDRRHPPAPASDDPALRVMPTLQGISAPDLARVLVDVIRQGIRTVDTSLLVGTEVSAEDAAGVVSERLAAGPVTFRALAEGRSLSWAVALFLAVLELAMRGEVRLGQAERLGDIEIERSEP